MTTFTIGTDRDGRVILDENPAPYLLISTIEADPIMGVDRDGEPFIQTSAWQMARQKVDTSKFECSDGRQFHVSAKRFRELWNAQLPEEKMPVWAKDKQ